MKKILLLSLLLTTQAAFSQTSDLEKRIESLNIPDDKVTPVLSEDKLYIVNTRYSSLINRHELSIQGANNFTSDSHLTTKQAAIAYRYHLNSKWSFGLRYNHYTNDLTSAGEKLFRDQFILPDTDFAFNSQEIFVNYNTIYGKLRWSSSRIVYFDQYVSLGLGKIELASGKTNLAFLDLGFAFWLGKHMSARVGFKNEFYKQTQVSGERSMHNGLGYVELGYLFGRGNLR